MGIRFPPSSDEGSGIGHRPSSGGGRALVAAGWYTFPDGRKRFPYGTRSTRDLSDVRFDPEEFLQVPITVLVGDQDITDVDLRCPERVMRQQGATRLERAGNWVGAMHAAARQYRFEPLVTIPGGDHSFANLMITSGFGDRVFLALFGAPVSNARRGDQRSSRTGPR